MLEYAAGLAHCDGLAAHALSTEANQSMAYVNPSLVPMYVSQKTVCASHLISTYLVE